jgi:hypothetical protein
MNYSVLTFFPYKLSTMTYDRMKVQSYDTFPSPVSQMDGQRR